MGISNSCLVVVLVLMALLDVAQMLDGPCGLSHSHGIGKIYGHVFTNESAYEIEFPWMTFLELPNRTRCGGTLISADWVLTAAHCVIGVDKSQLKAHLGRNNLSDPTEPYASAYDIINLKIHPDFTSIRDNVYRNDFALLQLNGSAIRSSVVGPACLPDRANCRRSGRSVETCSEVVVAGWGRSLTGRHSQTLLKLKMNISSTERCEWQYQTLIGRRFRIRDDLICAGGDVPNRDACDGDSGSPLMCVGPKMFVQVIGVVSFGHAFCDGIIPGVYGRVCSALDWIEDTVRHELTTSTTTSTTTTPPPVVREFTLCRQDQSWFSAARSGDLVRIKRRVELGRCIDAVRNDGSTALILASAQGHINIVRYLLRNKADFRIRDKSGKNALQYAALRGHSHVYGLLNNYRV